MIASITITLVLCCISEVWTQNIIQEVAEVDTNVITCGGHISRCIATTSDTSYSIEVSNDNSHVCFYGLSPSSDISVFHITNGSVLTTCTPMHHYTEKTDLSC